MVGAGALEVGAGVGVDEGGVADDHGVDERGLRRRPELVDLGDDAAVDARAQEFPAVADKAGEALDFIDADRGGGGDSMGSKIGDVVEGSGIVVVVRAAEAGGEAEAVAVMELGEGFVGVWLVEVQAEA